MKKMEDEIKFEKYSEEIMKKLDSYGIEAKQYDSGSISATFPGGKPVEFLSRHAFDSENLGIGFKDPYITKENADTLVVDNLQLLPLLKIFHEVNVDMGRFNKNR